MSLLALSDFLCQRPHVRGSRQPLWALLALLAAALAPPTGHADSIRVIPLATADIRYDPFSRRIYASLPDRAAEGGPSGNSVVAIEPITGALAPPIFVGSEPRRLALSDDGRYLYVALDGAAAIRQVDLAKQMAALQFPVGSDPREGTYYAEDLEVLPGLPESVAVARVYRSEGSSWYAGVAIFDNGVQRPRTTGPGGSINQIEVGATASQLYGYHNRSSGLALVRMAIDASGVRVRDELGYLFPWPTYEIKSHGGLIYASTGRVYNPELGLLVGTFPGIEATRPKDPFPASVPQPLVAPDAGVGRVFFLTGHAPVYTVWAFDQSTFVPLGTMAVPGVSGRPDSLIRWGTDGLAFRTTGGQLFLLRSPLVDGRAPFVDLAVTVAAVKAVKIGDRLEYRATVTNHGPETATGVMLTHALAPGLSLVSVRSTQGTCARSDGGLHCSLGALQAGDSATVTVTATALAEGSKSLAFHAAATESDADTANNEASAETQVYPLAVCAADVTARTTVRVLREDWLANNVGARQTVLLTNSSLQPIVGPVWLVLDRLPEGVTLANASGSTRCAPPLASPYIAVDVGADQVLMPGETATVMPELARNGNQSFIYRARVLAGSDAR